jgi:hypothetical protein
MKDINMDSVFELGREIAHRKISGRPYAITRKSLNKIIGKNEQRLHNLEDFESGCPREIFCVPEAYARVKVYEEALLILKEKNIRLENAIRSKNDYIRRIRGYGETGSGN